MKSLAILLALVLPASLAGDTFPAASRINVAALASDRAEVVGAMGAVAPQSDVIVITLETGHYDLVRAGADGSFRAQLFAPRGSTLMVKTDVSHGLVRPAIEQSSVIDFHFNNLVTIPGTVVRVPDPAPTAGEVAFGGATIHRNGDRADSAGVPVAIVGSLAKSSFDIGESLTVTTRVRVYAGMTGATPRVRAQLSLLPVTDSEGRARASQNTFLSTFMTPTGLPIERTQWPYTYYQAGGDASLAARDGALEADLSLTLPLHRDLPAAYYRPTLLLTFEGLVLTPFAGQTIITFLDSASRALGGSILLPMIRVGNAKPGRLPFALLMNDLEQAQRGVTAIEDRNRFGISPRIALPSERVVLSRSDPRTGKARRYNLEPYVPILALTDRGAPTAPPFIPLRFPSGSLRVTVRAPTGGMTSLGPVPIVQASFIGPGPGTRSLEGGPHITDPYQLRTGDDRFDFEFPSDGLHRIDVEMQVADIWGGIWNGRGTFEVEIARTLLVEPATAIGTPFEVGDSMALCATLSPPIVADVLFRVQFAPRSNRVQLIEKTFTARSNRFGHVTADAFRFDEPGEYRVDIVASGSDATRTRWSGARTWGGVVAPKDSTIIAHGMRGIDDEPMERRLAWFVKTPASGRGHVNLAFHSGDVMWLENIHAMTPVMSYQDPTSDVSRLFSRYCCGQPGNPGELATYSGNLDGLDVHIRESEPDLVGYSYRFVERPFVRVREVVAEGMSPYWRFNDLYGLQLGNGANGDLPNDFKFQFGGIVLRGALLGEPRYAIYGSLFVLLPDNDPIGTRVLPPFQGNGGGPSGGPLFTLKGKPIDIFFHPTGLRPGSILVSGNTASFAGQIGPTLPSKVEITVTSPSGKVRVISGQANKIGYFYDPSSDFRVDEPGVWRVRVKVWHEGLTSAGQVTPPYPTGDVLGSREGEFYFYVVRPDAPQLDIRPMQRFVRPADAPVTFTIAPPAGLTNVEMYHTTTMPGFILEEGATSTLTYTYDAQKLARDFPNLDLHDADGFAGADTITMSFLVTGLDSSGRRQYLARQVVLQGEELQVPEQNPVGRRRGARR